MSHVPRTAVATGSEAEPTQRFGHALLGVGRVPHCSSLFCSVNQPLLER